MRFNRQEKLDIIPKKFQERIKDKKIIVVGCGGIGSVLSEILVRGGFLSLILVDNDVVDETNLQRQIFVEKDLGKSKAGSLKKRLMQINKEAKIKVHETILDKENIELICKDCELIVDATDNFESRTIINDFCEKNNKDWIYNGAIKTEAMSCIFRGKDRLFNKTFPKQVRNIGCCEVGILASTTFLSASIGYNQILRYFLDEGKDKLIKIDLWKNTIFEVVLK